MSELHPVSPVAAAGTVNPLPSLDTYRTVVFQMLNDPDRFWLSVAGRLAWEGDPTVAKDAEGRWFSDGRLNLNDSCLDRHLFNRGDEPAIIWKGDGRSRTLTFQDLHEQVATFANGLKMLGLGQSSRVVLLMGSIPEMVIATLACARIGASWMPIAPYTRADQLRSLLDSFRPMAVITQDEARIPSRTVPTKNILAQALKADGHSVQFTIVVPHTGGPVGWKMGVDIWWEHSIMGASAFCPARPLPASTPQLYTEHGSSGIGGMLGYAAWSQAVVLDIRLGRMVGCLTGLYTHTGQTQGILATLANGATLAISELSDASALPMGVDVILAEAASSLTQRPRVFAVEGGISAEAWPGLRSAMPESALVGALSVAGGFTMATFPPAVPGGPGQLGLALPGSRALLLDDAEAPSADRERASWWSSWIGPAQPPGVTRPGCDACGIGTGTLRSSADRITPRSGDRSLSCASSSVPTSRTPSLRSLRPDVAASVAWWSPCPPALARRSSSPVSLPWPGERSWCSRTGRSC